MSPIIVPEDAGVEIVNETMIALSFSVSMDDIASIIMTITQGFDALPPVAIDFSSHSIGEMLVPSGIVKTELGLAADGEDGVIFTWCYSGFIAMGSKATPIQGLIALPFSSISSDNTMSCEILL